MSTLTPTQRALEWILGEDTGISSKVIWGVMMGVNVNKIGSYRRSTPCDPADFGRCYRLFLAVPEWEIQLKDLRSVNYARTIEGKEVQLWERFVENYWKMKDLYEQEMHLDKAPKLYEFMKSIGL